MLIIIPINVNNNSKLNVNNTYIPINVDTNTKVNLMLTAIK